MATTVNLRVVALAALLIVLQRSAMSHIRVFGVHPDLLLLACLVVAVTGGPTHGAVAGFAAGLTTDIFLPLPLGLSAFGYCMAGFAIGSLSSETDEALWMVALLAALGTAVAFLTFFVLGLVLTDVSITWAQLAKVTLVLGTLNFIASPVLVYAVRRVGRNSMRLTSGRW